MGCWKNPTRDAWASQVKNPETLLEGSVTIVMGVGSYVDPNLLSKMEVFIIKKEKKKV